MFRIPSLAALFSVLIAAVTLGRCAAEDWPAFRGPSGQGISQDARIPTEWSDTKNLAWKLKLPGAGFSSPIVVGDRVFVTCYSGGGRDLSKLKRHLVCVDRKKGTIKWAKEVAADPPEKPIPQFGGAHGFSSHTPVSDGKRVYVFFGNTGALAYDLDGTKLWQVRVGSKNASMFGSAASPILYKDTLIVTAAAESESIRGLDKLTGKEKWKVEGTLSRTYSTPVIAKNTAGVDEMFLSLDYETWGLNPTNGKLRWYAETGVDTNAAPSVVSKDGVAYVIGGRGGARAAIRSGKTGDVTKSQVAWATNGGSYVSSPVLHKGHLYWFNERGIANCVDIKTGKEAARKRLRGEFYASAVVIKDKIYAVSRFDGTYVFEATPEMKQIAHNSFDDDSDFSGSPAVSDGQLILRSDKYLYCIEAK